MLDSGTTLTYLPDALANAIFNEVGATYDSQAGVTLCSCAISTVQGTLSFGFAGANGPVIKVPIGEMVYPLTDATGTQLTYQSGQPACLFGIVPASSNGDAPLLFGDTLLRSAYVVYDLVNNRVGLAQTNFNSTGSNVVPFASAGAQIPSATTVANELAVTPTAGGGNVAPTAAGTAAGGSLALSAAGALFTGNAGPAFSSAVASPGAKKNAASAGMGASAWQQVVIVGLTMGLMGMGGIMFML